VRPVEYSVIRIGNKQHRVRDGETLVVDRVATDEGGSFAPEVLLGSAKVTVTVVAHERGPKIRIGKYRRRTGYKRHNGYRSATSRLAISIGAKPAPAKKAAPKAEAPAEPAAAPAPPKAEAAAEPAAAPAPPKAKAAAEPAAAPAPPKGMPAGYAELTVAAIAEAAKSWRRPQLEAALAYEQANARRKGALAALEAAIAAKEAK